MDEFSLINKIKQTNYKQSSLLMGIGDDAAVFRETANDLVTAVDTFVEGVHFTKDTMSPIQVGYRGLAANLSDIAAMGATPMYYLVSITVPKTWSENELTEIFAGMKKLANKYHVDLLGGDTVSGDQLVLSITIIGKVPANKARYRRDARVGDIVFVTGTLGDSRAGLYLLQHEVEHPDQDYFISRHQMPTPRIEFARALQQLERVSLNDISDGIASEAHEIAEASGVSIILEDKAIPIHKGLEDFSRDQQDKWKLFGGEDFELLGTTAKENWSSIKDVAEKWNVQVTEVGYVKDKKEHFVYIENDGSVKALAKAGYTHLK
ncbi:thiamine-phosphate kinase [Oceanobacillus sp. CAU 1775]